MAKHISQYKCPVCMLETPVKVFPNRILLDPADFGWITTRECRGRKGLPIIEKTAFINKFDEYPEIYKRLKDISLGLIHAFYNHKLIEIEDLPIASDLDIKDERIMTLEEEQNKLRENDEIKIMELKDKIKTIIDMRDENIFNKEDEIKRLKIRVNNLLKQKQIADQTNDNSQYYEEKIEELTEQNQQLQNQIEDMNVEGNY